MSVFVWGTFQISLMCFVSSRARAFCALFVRLLAQHVHANALKMIYLWLFMELCKSASPSIAAHTSASIFTSVQITYAYAIAQKLAARSMGVWHSWKRCKKVTHNPTKTRTELRTRCAITVANCYRSFALLHIILSLVIYHTLPEILKPVPIHSMVNDIILSKHYDIWYTSASDVFPDKTVYMLAYSQ